MWAKNERKNVGKNVGKKRAQKTSAKKKCAGTAIPYTTNRLSRFRFPGLKL